MRRIALVLAVMLGMVALTGCAWDMRDPVHPSSWKPGVYNGR